MTSLWKTSRSRPRWLKVNVSVLIWLYTLFPIFNVIRKYITGDHILTPSYIFSGVIYSMFVSDSYGLIQSIGPLYGVSYFYAAWLLRITLSPTLYLWSTIFILSRMLSLLICVCFHWRINSQSALYIIRRIISRQNINWPRLKLFNLFFSELKILLQLKCPSMGHLHQHSFL